MAGSRVLTAGVVATAFLVAAPAPGTQAATTRGITLVTPGTSGAVTFDAVTDDAVFFSTSQSLHANDADDKRDVYRFAGGSVALMTAEIEVDTEFGAATRDGSHVFVNARQGVVGPELAVWRHSATSGGIINWSTGKDAHFKALSADENQVLIESAEDATDFDEDDGAVDIMKIILDPSTGATQGQVPISSNTAEDVHLVGASPDFGGVIYRTDEKVDPVEDQNTADDLYGAGDVWSGPGYPPLLSDGVGGPDTFGAVAANGSAIVYTSADDNGTDTDGQADVFWSMGLGADLVSAGTSNATYAGSTPGLEAVFYSTTSPLTPGDQDLDADIYVRDTEGLPALISDVPSNGPAQIHAVGPTAEVLYGTSTGLYRFDDVVGASTKVSGDGAGQVVFGAMTDDGDVYFTSPDRLTTADTDDASDVYANEGGTLTLVSGGTADVPVTFEGVNADGSLVVFSTTEKLSAADTDAAADLYTFGEITAPPVTPPDTVAPAGSAIGKAQKSDGRIEVSLVCGKTESCIVTSSGTLTVPGVSRGKLKFELTGKKVTVAAGTKATLKLKVPKKGKKAAAAALKAGKTVKAKVSLALTDAAGNRRTVKVTVKLKT